MDDRPPQGDRAWRIGALLLVILGVFALRFGTSVLDRGAIYDEEWITAPINVLMEEGWSVSAALDYEETKGPTMIWPYAFIGEMLGGTINDLRLISVWCTILTMIPLGWLATCCGVRRGGHLVVAVGWLLLPYVAVFSQLVMSEMSFILLEVAVVAAAMWGLQERSNKRRRGALVLYGLLLALTLNHRIHVVAVAGAVCIASAMRLGPASWPWWAMTAAAGLLRLPLWWRWGGMVSPRYQNLHGLGFRVESLSYLAAAMAPLLALFAVVAWRRGCRKPLIYAAIAGAALVLLATPNLVVPEGMDLTLQHARFQGIARSLTTGLMPSGPLQTCFLALMAAAGLAGVAALWEEARQKPVTSPLWLIAQVQAWSLFGGWLLYALTRGFVFDRFLMAWAFMLPILWQRLLPGWAILLQYSVLALVGARLAWTWLL